MESSPLLIDKGNIDRFPNSTIQYRQLTKKSKNKKRMIIKLDVESYFDRVNRELILIYRKRHFLSGLDQVDRGVYSIVWLAVLMNGRPSERKEASAKGLVWPPTSTS